MGRSTIAGPLRRAADLLRGFIRTPALRLAWIEAELRLQPGAARIVAGCEYHADNHAVFVPLRGTGWQDVSRDWAQAIEALRQGYEGRRLADAPLEEYEAADQQGSAGMAVQLVACARGVQAPAEGLMLLVQPGPRPSSAWLARLAEMLAKPELAAVRAIVVTDPLPGEDRRWVEPLGAARTLHIPVEVNEPLAVREIEQALESESMFGVDKPGVWPRGVVIPGRPALIRSKRGDSKPSTSERQTEAAADEPRDVHRLRALVRKAALAMRRGEGPEAIRLQTEARTFCDDRAWPRDGVQMGLVLGGYLAALQQPRLAMSAFEQAAETADQGDVLDLRVQALLALASVAMSDGDAPAAFRAYRQAIEAAKKAEQPRLVMEAYWKAGECARSMQLELDCIGLWADAIAYVDEHEGVTHRVRDIGTGLSELLVKHRQFAEARRIERIVSSSP